MSQSLPEDFPIDPATTSGSKLAEILNRFNAAFTTNSSGATAPTDTTPGMFWLDTSGANPVMRIRNAANTAWLKSFDTVFDQNASLAQLGIPNHNLLNVSSTGGVGVGVAGQQPYILLNKSASNIASYINATVQSKPIWQMMFGDGASAAGDFSLNAFNDAGAFSGTPLFINRATNAVAVVTPATGDRSNRVATTQTLMNELPGATTAPGWQRMPNGSIFQWGDQTVTTDAGGNAVLTFPLAFPVSVSAVLMTNGNAGVGLVDVSALRSGWPTLTGAAVHVQNSNAGTPYVGNAQVAWLAIGK